MLLLVLDAVLWLLHTVATTYMVLYCLNCYLLIFLYRRYRKRMLRHDSVVSQAWQPLPQALPRISVQLPLYNERYVVERLLHAVARLHYPRQLLQIQVLDDSTDETTALAARLVARYRRQGLDITLVHRQDRQGYKAGALQAGLAQASGEFIAIFDADFVPEPDFLQRTLPFFADPGIAVVQTRWGHINQDYSPLTAAYAMGLDGHFGVEQAARCWAGLFMNFNGTGGLWRRCAIDDAGGWQADTLTEDLDLSYRAQLRGWSMKFLPQVVCPGEIPVQMSAIKSQQQRWAKGAAQTAKKLLPRFLQAPLPLLTKAHGFFHLTTCFIHPIILFVTLISPLPLWFEGFVSHREPFFGSLVSSLAAFGPLSVFLYAQVQLARHWHRRLHLLPVLLSLGVGISLNNTKAVLAGLYKAHGTFVRTPKFGIEHASDTWADKRYRPPFPWVSLGELGLAAYCAYSLWSIWQQQVALVNPYLILYTVGFATVAVLSLWEHLSPPPPTASIVAPRQSPEGETLQDTSREQR
jgi:cellulose synthase/poly-beta-1,6-N-acetylglucosamine synthase-like glycosyltransferase